MSFVFFQDDDGVSVEADGIFDLPADIADTRYDSREQAEEAVRDWLRSLKNTNEIERAIARLGEP